MKEKTLIHTFRILVAIIVILPIMIACKGNEEVAIVSVAEITLNKTDVTLAVGESEILTANIMPDNATDKTVVWTSSNVGIASVDNQGKVIAEGEGQAIISATTVDGNKTATCTITVLPVAVSVDDITLAQTELTLVVGQTETLIATITPDNATDKTIVWSSSNTDIATVDSQGNVTAEAVGEATISATTVDGDKTATCMVTVLFPAEPTVVEVEGGTFSMGCTNDQGGDCNPWEYPVHQVTLSSFKISIFEVTQAQWKTVMGNAPSYFTGDNLPVEQVSWNDIVGTNASAVGYTEKGVTYYQNGFCYKLSVLANGGTLGLKHYRLPTEAEWEFAARGGNNSAGYMFSGSNDASAVAWYGANSDASTHEVGSKAPNELGIYDMSGNLWEWCGDMYNNYTAASQTDPQPNSGYGPVIRGGCFYTGDEALRASYRSWITPEYREWGVGFRLAL